MLNDGDYMYPCETYYPRAKKTHKCCECLKDIPPGDIYQKVTGLSDGRWTTYKTCKRCEELRDDVGLILSKAYRYSICLCYTELSEYLAEHDMGTIDDPILQNETN